MFLKKPKEMETPLWASEEQNDEEIASDDSEPSSSELKIPEGWTLEQYRLWLEGEMPEGWTLVQWVLFRDEQLELLAEQ